MIFNHKVYLLHDVVHLHVWAPPDHKSRKEHDIAKFVDVKLSSVFLRVLHFVVCKHLIELLLESLEECEVEMSITGVGCFLRVSSAWVLSPALVDNLVATCP